MSQSPDEKEKGTRIQDAPPAGASGSRSNLIVRSAKSLYWRAHRYWKAYKPVIDLAGGAGGTVLLAGTARSGTTWVGNVITAMMGARGIFEPMLVDQDKHFALLQSRYLSEARLLRNYQLYIPPGAGRNSPYFAPVGRILRGNVSGPWCHSVTRAGLYTSRVIKEVRANLMLSWLATTWPELKIIWLVRDPVAVIESQITAARTGWRIGWEPECVLDQPQALADWLAPYAESWKQAREPWELLAHKWCIETLIPLRQQILKQPNVLLVRYEKLRKGWDAWEPVALHVKTKPWDRQKFETAFAERSLTAIGDSREPGAGGKSFKLDSQARDAVHRTTESYDLTSFLADSSPKAAPGPAPAAPRPAVFDP